jgi:hypothetical protein
MRPEDIATITAQFEPVSLEELNQRAALQTRADNKYFLPWSVFVDFAAALRSAYVVLDIDGQRTFTYDTQYFDTASLTCYWAHVQGRRKRFKCRSRQYVDSGLCVFELKLKGGRGETVKYKMAYSEAECEAVTPAASSFLQQQISTAYGLTFIQPMLPTLRTQYQRITLTAEASMERVTCDLNLAFAVDQCWQGQMAPGYVLVETKSARGRGRADQLLWQLGARPATGSKYCLGLSLLRPDLRNNPFQRARNRYFVRDDALETERLTERAVAAPPARPIADPRPPVRATAETLVPALTPLPGITTAYIE